MKATPLTDESLFLQALELESPEEQAAFLDRACGDNAQLRSSVEELFRHHRAASGFLESPPTEVVAAADAITAHHQDHSVPPLHFLEPAAAAGPLGRLGHYEIEQVVGAGGFGVVLKARDTKLDRIVAVKTLAQSLASSTQARQRFVREAKAAAAVKHDNVVGIHAVSDEGPVPYLVMEFVSGVSLEEKLQQAGMLELPAILRIGSQIASGLAAAHQQGLVHRDVKPANILLENGVERVKITDFGLARAANDATITREGEVAGTPQYMSPEQAQSQPLDSRSDLFSLGSVLYAACTGHSPFRAASPVAALRRVCDDTPRPIRELNPEIPDWLVAIINRLLAKQPDERFQTAAEVADLLGQHLAELQHPDLDVKIRTRSESKIQNPKSRIRGRWLFAAVAAALLLLLGVSLTEATGLTQFAPTLIRIVTGEGTLLVEVNDPAVKITVEGDGGLVITGAGLHEVHLKPGKYQLNAEKGGQRVPLTQELVTITRGKQEVVRVRLESPATARPAAAAPAPESQPFVIMNAQGTVVRKSATLVEAVLRSSDGDTIEIRGNGPFATGTIRVASRLTIRAGQGFRPVISYDVATFTQGRSRSLLDIRAPLVLEGLEFQGDDLPIGLVTVYSSGVPLHVANCRFIKCELMVHRTAACQLRNSQFSASNTYAILFTGGSAVTLDNNIVATGSFVPIHLLEPEKVQRMEITRNIITTGTSDARSVGILISFRSPGTGQTAGTAPLHLAQNIVSGPGGILCSNLNSFSPPEPPPLSPAELERLPREWLAWHEEHNLYSTGTPLLKLSQGRTMTTVAPTQPLKTLAEWNQYWGQSDTGSIEGVARFQGGAAVHSAPYSLVPNDFRLRSDSAGYRAGQGGKDLGPDIDLVGPGDAYERWKKTPAYEEWQRSIRQAAAARPVAAVPAPPESQAFVVLGRDGRAEQKLGTLAEAVLKSSEGDTIEIRGNGPFTIQPMRLTSARVIRAGKGFSPVIKVDAQAVPAGNPARFFESTAPVVLEGLEFQPVSPNAQAAVTTLSPVPSDKESGALYVSNCRFIGCGLMAQHVSACQIRNCALYWRDGSTIGFFVNSARLRAVVDNNIAMPSATGAAVGFGGIAAGQQLTLTRNFLGGHVSLSYVVHGDETAKAIRPVSLESSQNVWARRRAAVWFFARKDPLPEELSSGGKLETLLRQVIDWQEHSNLYPAGVSLLSLSNDHRGTLIEPTRSYQSLGEWNQLWGVSDTASIQVAVRCQGGDVLQKLELAPEKITLQDFRLRDDSAGYRAGPDGKDLGPDIDLVGPGAAYERWKQTPEYQVWLKETGQIRDKTPPAQASAFVVLGGKGVAEQKLDTLAEAVLKSSDGDSIEVRGNGPYLTPPTSTARKALTIRAGQGFRPVVKLDLTNVAPDARAWMLRTTAPLVVEGIEFQIHRPDNPPGTKGSPPVGQCTCLHTVGAPLRVANCRFLGVGNAPFVFAEDAPELEVRNSLLIGQRSTIYAVPRPGSRCRLDNNLLCGSTGFGLYVSVGESAPSSISITRNTVVGGFSAVSWFLHEWESALAAQSKSTQKLIHCDVAGNLFYSQGTHTVWSASFDSALPGKRRQPNQDELRQAMRTLVDWNERDNGYWFSGHFANTMDGSGLHPVQTLEDWVAFWGLKETGSTTGAVRFQDGDLPQLSQSNAASLSPDSFQLRSDSLGYRADKKERNLGADVSLVGPGAAYERWQKTPEYDEWQRSTKQANAARPAAAVEPQSFVVLGRDGRAEQKLDTLAEAVQKSSEGDTIEIRGNGPFEAPQLSIATALTIRAGVGYRPVIEAVQGVDSARRPHFLVTRGPLILEGLEFQASVSGRSDCTLIVQDASCYVANCRFSRCRLLATRAPHYQVRNSHFSTTGSDGLIVSSALQGATQVVDNNLVTNGLAASGPGARIDIRRNLVLGTRGSIGVAASNPSLKQLPVGLHASQNIFVGTPILRFTEPATVPLRTTAPSGAELETVIRSVIHWQEDGNLYSEGARFFSLSYGTGPTSGGGFGFTSVEPSRPYRTLSEWNEFWGQSDTGAIQGRAQFQGGDAVYSTPHTLEPDAFRLREGSPGYRAGEGGKDLGPDIDLVGPGAAYERWKTTPEYQKWLEETGQKK